MKFGPNIVDVYKHKGLAWHEKMTTNVTREKAKGYVRNFKLS